MPYHWTLLDYLKSLWILISQGILYQIRKTGKFFSFLFLLVCFFGVIWRIQNLELWNILRQLSEGSIYCWHRFWEVSIWGAVFCLAVMLIQYREKRK